MTINYQIKSIILGCSFEYFFIPYLATECPLPPAPPEDGGNVIVRHTGLFFGTICPGSQSYQPLPGSGTV